MHHFRQTLHKDGLNKPLNVIINVFGRVCLHISAEYQGRDCHNSHQALVWHMAALVSLVQVPAKLALFNESFLIIANLMN